MTFIRMTWLLVMGIILTSCVSEQGDGPESATASLVLLGGKVVTVDRDLTMAEAVGVRDGRIVAVGDNEEIRALIGLGTEVVDLDGELVLPGLIDGHAHLHSLGAELANLDVTGTASYEAVVARVAARVKEVEPGEWILGGRWDQNDWPEKTFPEHGPLSAVSPENPVYLRRIDGNSGFANAMALRLAGITRETPDPAGGKIIRDAQGEPTGVLINQAMNLVKRQIPGESRVQARERFLQAVESCLAVGLTGVHEAGVGPAEISMYKGLIDQGRLPLRVYAMLGNQEKPRFDTDDLPAYFRSQRIDSYGDHLLSVRSIKLFFDGALGSRGAAFFEPYADDPENTGLLRISPEYITEVAVAALQADMGVNTHCIGVRGNRLCLDAYADALVRHPKKDHRLRIEHAQIVRRTDVDRFAELGVIPAMQPTHCTSDMGFVSARIGKERSRGAYAWRWFLDAGLVIPAGSDFPVESNNPLLGIYAAITRQDAAGRPEGGWFPEHRMSRIEAIKAFTLWAAYGAFQENILGSIEVGKLADFTILDRDILEIEPREILTTKVLYTIVGGKIRYRAMD